MSQSLRCIRVRGARQHNLKNLSLDIPHHQLTVITGLSGSGKSSLAFDTLYAEGQRRYVETFSPYTRQFLERMDKPDVDSIEGIPPAIAIEQSNPVKTSRSTVGTMTEIADYLKLLFARTAALNCPHCGRLIKPYTSQEIAESALAQWNGRDVLVVFRVGFEQKPSLASTLAALRQQGYVRVWSRGRIVRTDDNVPASAVTPSELFVIQDRLVLNPSNRSRLSEAVENCLRHGKGIVRIIDNAADDTKPGELRFANSSRCPYDEIDFPEPSPALFSFNNPLGACPTCRGFGRTIDIDYERALPDRSLSIAGGVVKPWQSGMSAECQRDLLKHCRKQGIPTNVPFRDLSRADQKFVIEGEMSKTRSLQDLWETGGWYGIKGFFQWLETKTYKMHVRVLLSRYRAYRTCPDCHGGRLQPEALSYRIGPATRRLNLADVNQLTLRDCREFIDKLTLSPGDEASVQLKREVSVRLAYLLDVGLGYLTLDRPTRTLSGGEVQRVNLTSCLGNALVNTLFVLDEPSIGLHPRDTQQLVHVIHQLRDRGNTLIIVEHEEALMRNADHVIDLGPGRGELGGNLTFSGSYPELLRDKKSLTGKYLRGEASIRVPPLRRKIDPAFQLKLHAASAHNLKNIDLSIPLGVFVGISGVSGSGKSTLVHDVLYRALKAEQTGTVSNEEEDGIEGLGLQSLQNGSFVSEVIRVDQSPLSKTPRSNPALYLGIYDRIRQLFASTEEAQAQGLTASDFSFNGGNGRCPRCSGMGYERISMQFLADVFVTCPVCEGKRFQSHILNIPYRDRSIDAVLNLTVHEALDFFSAAPEDLSASQRKQHQAITDALRLLAEVGLDYLRLGQPLNQLSGGEAQRVKLLSYLSTGTAPDHSTESGVDDELPPSPTGLKLPRSAPRPTRLFILDEPTTGLHFEDIRLLIGLLQRLVDQGNSLIVIEHNLDVLKCADWLIDLGPEAGDGGGEVVVTGTPEDVVRHQGSHTGTYLREKLKPTPLTLRESVKKTPRRFAAPECIEIRGARHHNLKNLSLDITLNRTTVVTGLSGSGKSTLAFDLLFAEGQRRYLESLNAYARQFVEQMEKPAVNSITGIPPAVAIEQRLTQGGRKSTIATVTEIHQFLRLLYAKLGEARDPQTGEAAIRQTPEEIFLRLEKARQGKDYALLAPLIRARKGFHTEIARWAEKKGYPALRVDGKWIEPRKFKPLDRYSEHTIDLVLGNISNEQKASERRRLIETALELGHGTLFALDPKGKATVYSTHLFCPQSGRSFDELDPRLFSYNSPHGWCPNCEGYGTILEVNVEAETEAEREAAVELAREQHEEELQICPVCRGQRLNEIARAVQLTLPHGKRSVSRTLPEISGLTIRAAGELFRDVVFTGREAVIARGILPEIQQRLAFLEKVGLGYLTLDRSAPTLSGGESQRIRLASQLGSNLQGVLYVLDEPTIGLHPRDNQQLLRSLAELRDHGNTLVIVEHDEDTMKAADHIIDLGPEAGTRGGEIVAQGSWKELAKNRKSITGRLLGNPLHHPLSGQRRPLDDTIRWCHIHGASANNLKNLDIDLPTGRLIAICGVSGAGKSTLVHDILRPALTPRRRGESAPKSKPWKRVEGADIFSAVYEVDQSPIGKTSRSTPATYIGLMDDIRALFAQLPLARQRGYGPNRFSFNSGAGRCQTCLGQGTIKVEMNFLPSVYVPCEACQGRRYNAETLEVKYNERSISEVLNMTIEEAARFFSEVPRLQRTLQLLAETGLGYLTLGQRSPTLSGGEAQRIKLVAELARSLGTNINKKLHTPGFSKTHHLYLLEEPTIGLHLADVKRLLDVMHQLVDSGHTVVVIEHHLDVIAEADYVLELGPEGGDAGGRIIASGTPEQIARSKKSITGPFLA